MDGEAPPQIVALVRHGEAMSKELDARRPLSAAGREQVETVAARLAGLGVALDEVRHSGKDRARETAEILASRLGLAPDRVRAADGLKPNDDVEAVAERLETEPLSVALVGHLPFMGLLASRLLTDEPGRLQLRFQDAGCLLLARTEGGWRLDGFLNHELRR